jgi:hypothetical protein
MNSQTLPIFWKLYRKLPVEVRRAAQEAYRQFLADPSHPSLHFERLFNNPLYWSVRITRNHRAVGILQGDTITWVWIGDHKAFDRAFPK